MKRIRKHLVLGLDERKRLVGIVRNGEAKAKEILHANILLKLDEGQKNFLRPIEVAKNFGVSRETVREAKKRYLTGGLDSALKRKKREKPPIEPKITGAVEAKIIQIACSQPPSGFARWTLRMMADRAVKLEVLTSLSHESVRTLLKKTNSSLT